MSNLMDFTNSKFLPVALKVSGNQRILFDTLSVGKLNYQSPDNSRQAIISVIFDDKNQQFRVLKRLLTNLRRNAPKPELFSVSRKFPMKLNIALEITIKQ